MNRLPESRTRRLGTADIQALLKRGFDALSARRITEASACCRTVLSVAPKNVEAHFLVGLIATDSKDSHTAIRAFGSVTTLDPAHAAGWAQLARCFMKIGLPNRAEKAVERAIEADTDDPVVADLIGTTLSALGDQNRARAWFSKAVEKSPKSPEFNLNLASSLIFLGETEAADAALDRALSVRPFEPQAHWRKSNLRRATDRSHLDILHGLIDRFRSNPRALSFVAYAAGKEYEDLGEWSKAFEHFELGAKAKRQVIDYDEAEEIDMFDALGETFNRDWADRQAPGPGTSAPIFIIGQPRTGTTLVERIITSHSMVHSAGELQQFRLAIRRHAQVESSKRFSAEIVRASGQIEPVKIGDAYMKSSATMQGDLPRFVDKMPVNYLHVPLIIKALPNAKIIHLVRSPMDSCFSSFKQLFAEAYFHSYTLEEMARHYVRYYRLMDYWRELFPEQMLDVRYEDVVSDLESNARRMIGYLELPWEDACLEFHRQDRPVTTASAVQVREKAHTRSVNRWRRYESQLAPVQQILRSEGIID